MSLIEKEKNNSKKYRLSEEDIEYNNEKVKIVELTSDNVSRVEAMISTDSNYRQINEETIINNLNRGKIKYKGTSKYWISQLKEIIDTDLKESSHGNSYEKIIENIIISIDIENSTHLNSDGQGRNAIKNKILKLKRTEFKKLLKDEKKEYKLLNCLQEPNNDGEKRHFSFATKFCHYVSLVIFEGTDFEDNYSIYDNVLKKALCKYIKKYLDETISDETYENKYEKYIEYIDKIRDKAEKNMVRK